MPGASMGPPAWTQRGHEVQVDLQLQLRWHSENAMEVDVAGLIWTGWGLEKWANSSESSWREGDQGSKGRDVIGVCRDMSGMWRGQGYVVAGSAPCTNPSLSMLVSNAESHK